MILPLGICVDILRSIAGQLQKLVSVLTDRHRPLLERQELLFLHCHQTCWNMILTEIISKFLLGDGVGVGVGGEVGLPPLLVLLLCHDCSINQVLKGGEGMIHQLIV